MFSEGLSNHYWERNVWSAEVLCTNPSLCSPAVLSQFFCSCWISPKLAAVRVPGRYVFTLNISQGLNEQSFL